MEYTHCGQRWKRVDITVSGWILRKVDTTKRRRLEGRGREEGWREERRGGGRGREKGGREGKEVCAGGHLVVFSCIRAIDRDQLRLQDLRMGGWVEGEVV